MYSKSSLIWQCTEIFPIRCDVSKLRSNNSINCAMVSVWMKCFSRAWSYEQVVEGPAPGSLMMLRCSTKDVNMMINSMTHWSLCRQAQNSKGCLYNIHIIHIAFVSHLHLIYEARVGTNTLIKCSQEIGKALSYIEREYCSMFGYFSWLLNKAISRVSILIFLLVG